MGVATRWRPNHPHTEQVLLLPNKAMLLHHNKATLHLLNRAMLPLLSSRLPCKSSMHRSPRCLLRRFVTACCQDPVSPDQARRLRAEAGVPRSPWAPPPRSPSPSPVPLEEFSRGSSQSWDSRG